MTSEQDDGKKSQLKTINFTFSSICCFFDEEPERPMRPCKATEWHFWPADGMISGLQMDLSPSILHVSGSISAFFVFFFFWIICTCIILSSFYKCVFFFLLFCFFFFFFAVFFFWFCLLCVLKFSVSVWSPSSSFPHRMDFSLRVHVTKCPAFCPGGRFGTSAIVINVKCWVFFVVVNVSWGVLRWHVCMIIECFHQGEALRASRAAIVGGFLLSSPLIFMPFCSSDAQTASDYWSTVSG